MTPDPETVITVPVNMSTNCEAGVPVRIPLVPPVRLMKCIGKRRSHHQEAVRGDRKRQTYITRTKNVRDAAFNKRRNLRHDLRSSSHCLDAGEPLKRHNTNLPSLVDQKRARWQVVAFGITLYV